MREALLLAALWCGVPAAAGGPALRVETLGPREGLPAETIGAILAARTGLLWLGTREGLYRYDGYGFTAYQHDVTNPHSLVDNWVRTLYEDRAGRLWVGTNTGGLNLFDPGSERVTAFRHEPDDPASLSHDSVYAIAEDVDGALWVGTQSGLNRLESDGARFERVPLLPAGDPAAGMEYVHALLATRDGMLWVATVGHGVFQLDPRTRARQALPIDPARADALPSADVFALAQDEGNDLWIGTRAGVVVRTPERAMRRVRSRPGMEIEETIITSLAVTQSGEVWAGTLLGLYQLSAAGEPLVLLTAPAGLSNARVLALLDDGEGGLWVGTAGGLNRLVSPAAPFSVTGRAPSEESRAGLGFDDVYSMLEDPDGQVWVGTFGGGVERLDPSTGLVERFPFSENGKVVGAGVVRLARDPSGAIWAGCSDGLFRLDPATGRFSRWRPEPGRDDGLGRGYVTALLVDGDDRVWVGTGGGGLHRLRADGRGFERFPQRAGDPATPSDEYVTVLLQDSEGRLWEGTRSGGLNIIDRQTGRATRIPVERQRHDGFPHHYVTSLLEDRSGRLWIGTGGGGLVRLIEIEPGGRARFERLTTRDGLVDDNVLALVEDCDGSLWITTRRGLSRYDRARGAFLNFDAADGLPSSEFNVSAAAAGRRMIWLGSTQGLVGIPRGTRFAAPPPSRLVLTSIRSPAGRTPVAPGSAWPPERITVNYRDILALEFAVTDYDPHRRHRYAYRIDGNSNPWVDLGARRDVTFTDLPPGTHVVSIRGRGARGRWSDPPVTLRVDVVPPLYRTRWFMALSVVVLAGVLLSWHEMRTKRLQRRNRELTELQRQREAALLQLRTLTRRLEASKEEERKRIARELHDELGQLLTAAKINLQLLLRRTPDEIGARQIADTVDLIDQMIKLARALSFDLRPPLLDEMGLAGALRGFLRGQERRSGLAIDFVVQDVPPRLPTELEIAAFRIVQEASTNVIRHADAARLTITLGTSAGRLKIAIRDDGHGFEPDQALAQAAAGEHVGLTGIMERAQALGGEVRIESRPGAGTDILVELPLTV